MYIDQKAVLNALTKEDVIKVVMALGSGEPKHSNNGELIFQTVCHNLPNPNNSYKLYYYHEPSEQYKGRTFHCYTHCSESFGIIELIMRANRVQGKTLTFYKALYFLASTTGHLIEVSDKDIPQTKHLDFSWLDKLTAIRCKKSRPIPNLTPYNENILECFNYDISNLQQWIDEGISAEALGRFEIGFNIPTNQITIPHRSYQTEELIGVRGRFVKEDDAEHYGKYVPMYIEGEFLRHTLGSTLYGLWVTKNYIKEIGKVLVVEAEKSCLQAYTFFGEQSYCAGLCGSNFTQTQKKILIQELGVSKIIFCPDRDYHESDTFEATAWWQKQVKKVRDLTNYCDVYIIADQQNRLGYKDSPLDCGKEVFLQLYEEKIKI